MSIIAASTLLALASLPLQIQAAPNRGSTCQTLFDGQTLRAGPGSTLESPSIAEWVFPSPMTPGEWVTMFSKEAISKFDYIFTDSMTYADDHGRRMRLWIEDEPIDIYVNPTFLPQRIAAAYDQLWTESRMQRVIAAAVQNDVAIEINARYRLPSKKFILLARRAGAKFSFGMNNSARDVGDLDYCLQMIRECELGWQDMFVPHPDGARAARLNH